MTSVARRWENRPRYERTSRRPVGSRRGCRCLFVDYADANRIGLADSVDHYDVDPRHVYVTGLSCGAIGSWNYLGQHPDNPLAAAVLIAGGGYAAVDEAGCALGSTPVWAFHGERDDIIPVRYDVNTLARLEACTTPAPTDARLTLYPDSDHDSWSRTYDLSAGYDIYGWLLSHSK